MYNLEYNPSFLYKNHHYNTIVSSKFRKRPFPEFKRKRYVTPDDDFLDLDILKGNGSKGVLLLHGLEGSTNSIYIRSLSYELNQMGYWVFALNFRGCSGQDNLLISSYHSGKTDDVDFIIKCILTDYPITILNAVGFSLGGNVLMRYLGEITIKKPIELYKCISVSAPLDLKSSSKKIGHWSNILYLSMFLKTLKEKAKIKNEKFPNSFDIESILNAQNFFEYDDAYTGPVHGFKDAFDYYKKASALFVLDKINTPFLLISAKDDSFLSSSSLPTTQSINNPNMTVYYPEYGGHVGFGGDKFYENGYIESAIIKYFEMD